MYIDVLQRVRINCKYRYTRNIPERKRDIKCKERYPVGEQRLGLERGYVGNKSRCRSEVGRSFITVVFANVPRKAGECLTLCRCMEFWLGNELALATPKNKCCVHRASADVFRSQRMSMFYTTLHELIYWFRELYMCFQFIEDITVRNLPGMDELDNTAWTLIGFISHEKVQPFYRGYCSIIPVFGVRRFLYKNSCPILISLLRY